MAQGLIVVQFQYNNNKIGTSGNELEMIGGMVWECEDYCSTCTARLLNLLTPYLLTNPPTHTAMHTLSRQPVISCVYCWRHGQVKPLADTQADRYNTGNGRRDVTQTRVQTDFDPGETQLQRPTDEPDQIMKHKPLKTQFDHTERTMATN